MKEFFRKLGYWIHRFFPKVNNAVIWSWPDGEDSGIALEQALQKRNVKRVILLTSDPDQPRSWELGIKTTIIEKNTLRGVFLFLTAKFVFFTHPCFGRIFPPNVMSVNVWHGMAIKKICYLLPGDRGIACSCTLSTSPFWADIMERAMNPGGWIPDIGLPRNDRLFLDKRTSREKAGFKETQKIAVWMPTYRKSVRGLQRNDGVETGNVFAMDGIDVHIFNDWLASRDMVMLVKAHPMAADGEPINLSNLRVINNSWLQSQNLSLYEFLGASDCLVTDISSVVIDYLLLDRPVIHTFPDLLEYQSSRGFTVTPIDNYFAGPVASTYDELTEALEAIAKGCDPLAEKRRELCNLSHTHKDGMATERLMQAVGL